MNFAGFYFGGPIDALRKEGFRVVVPDQIGYGRSSKPIIPYNFHDMALNTKLVLDSLGIEKALDRRPLDGRHARGALRGVSIRRSPSGWCSTTRSASSIRAGASLVQHRRQLQSRRSARPTSIRASIQRYVVHNPDAYNDDFEKYTRVRYAWTLSGDWPRLAMVQTLINQVTYLDQVIYDWPHIKAPTLVFGGENDGANFPAGAKRIADTIPGAQLLLVPKAGHVLHYENPELFNRELLKFLKSDAKPATQQP